MSHPTYRERTKKFRQLRNTYVNNKTYSSGSDGPLLPNTNDQYLMLSINPIWIEIVESIDNNINKIENQIGSLKEYHSLRQREIFNDNKANEYDINIQEITHSITSLLKASTYKLQEIATKGNQDSNILGFEERTARYNAMRSRAIKLQEITKIFRNQQRQFLQQMEKVNMTHKYIDIGNVSQTLPDLSSVCDAQYTLQQIEWIEQKEKDASEREQKILEIVKSVHELAMLFNDLSVLVVEQGSLLDRIDYNVEKTLETIQNTVPIIDRTNKIHKKSKSALCIIVLILLIILCGIGLVLRHIL